MAQSTDTPDGLILPPAGVLAELARTAGEVTLQYFRASPATRDKGGNLGIVTEADLASEKVILDFIRANFPEHAILAEESGMHGSATVPAPQAIWIVDPLDGTTNFSKGNPYYCVSIAVAIRTGPHCEVMRAAIHHPATGDTYVAARGEGATVNGVPLSISAQPELARASLVTGFAGNKGASLREVVEAMYTFQDRILGVRVNGAAALDLAMTARGIFDGFYERNLSPWDTAAGALLLAESGAKVTNFKGQPFHALRDDAIVAANAGLHEQILRVLGTTPLIPA